MVVVDVVLGFVDVVDVVVMVGWLFVLCGNFGKCDCVIE